MNIACFEILPMIVIYTIIKHSLNLYNESTIFLKKYYLYLDKLVISLIFLKFIKSNLTKKTHTLQHPFFLCSLPLLKYNTFYSISYSNNQSYVTTNENFLNACYQNGFQTFCHPPRSISNTSNTLFAKHQYF